MSETQTGGEEVSQAEKIRQQEQENLKKYYDSLTPEEQKQLSNLYSEEDSTLIIQLPRQDKSYFIKKLGLITYPEEIEILGIYVQREPQTGKKQPSELDDERSLTEASKYTQFISQCKSLRKFSFSVEYQQHFMDYSDLLFYSLESLDIEDIYLNISGLSKSKDTLSKILKSVKTFKNSIKKLTLRLNDIFLNDQTFTALFLLIKHAPSLEELSLVLDSKCFIQVQKGNLFCKILESATKLKKVSIRFAGMQLLSGESFSFEQSNISFLHLDFLNSQLFNNSFITQIIGNNGESLKEVSLIVNADNNVEDIFIALYHLPNLLKLHFESPKYFQEEQYKTIKNFICKKSSIMYFSLQLNQGLDIMYDRSTRLFKNLPYLCSFKEITDVKIKRREALKKMNEYYIGNYIKFRRNYIYSLLALRAARKQYRKTLPKEVWDDMLNDFVTFDNLDQLIVEQ